VTTINENSGPGRVVYTAAATDTDFVSPATANSITYSLKNGGDAVAINAGTGAVTLFPNPDYEAKTSYSFTVVATDAAGNAAEKPVTLNIANVDEVAPSFTSPLNVPSLIENSGPNQVVYTATAVDTGFVSPATANSVTYSLSAASSAGLAINASTGVVTLAGNPNYEAKSSYDLYVIATDAAGNTAQKFFALNITNVDEVAPVISSGATATPISENSGAGQVVYTAAATDTDFNYPATANSIKYSLNATSDTGLTIDANTGAVTLTGNPDYETKSSYNFTVVATDLAGNHSEKAVTLGITDVNENVTPQPQHQLVFLLAAGDGGPWLDGGDGILGGARSDDVLAITASNAAGQNVHFDTNSVTVKVLGIPGITDGPLDITGFGPDDRVEINLKAMQHPFGTGSTAVNNFNGPKWTAYVYAGSTLTSGAPNFHKLAEVSASSPYAGLTGTTGSSKANLFLTFSIYSLNLYFRGSSHSPSAAIFTWKSTSTTVITPNEIAVIWPDITPVAV